MFWEQQNFWEMLPNAPPPGGYGPALLPELCSKRTSPLCYS